MDVLIYKRTWFWTNNVLLNKDRRSEMQLEIYVKKPLSQSTRHLNIRFFIKYQVEQVYMKSRYFPTEDMVADIYTKPLQITAFKKIGH